MVRDQPPSHIRCRLTLFDTHATPLLYTFFSLSRALGYFIIDNDCAVCGDSQNNEMKRGINAMMTQALYLENHFDCKDAGECVIEVVEDLVAKAALFHRIFGG